jgi:ribosome biogenesis protein ENP2
MRRFVTKADLVRLGLEHLMGTALLRAYMHGFFIDNRLYSKAVALVNPMGYEQYRQQRLAAKMEEERKSRISMVRKLPKVRGEVAEDRRGRGREGVGGGDGWDREGLPCLFT